MATFIVKRYFWNIQHFKIYLCCSGTSKFFGGPFDTSVVDTLYLSPNLVYGVCVICAIL